MKKEHAESPIVATRFSPIMIKALDTAAKQAGMSRAALLRDLVTHGLAGRGYWPPVAEEKGAA